MKRRLAGKRVLGVPNTCLDPALYAVDGAGGRPVRLRHHAPRRGGARAPPRGGGTGPARRGRRRPRLRALAGALHRRGPGEPGAGDGRGLPEGLPGAPQGLRRVPGAGPAGRDLRPALLRATSPGPAATSRATSRGRSEPASIDARRVCGARSTPGDRSAGPRRSWWPEPRSPPWWAGSCSRTTGPSRSAAATSCASTRRRSSSARRSSATPSTDAEGSLARRRRLARGDRDAGVARAGDERAVRPGPVAGRDPGPAAHGHPPGPVRAPSPPSPTSPSSTGTGTRSPEWARRATRPGSPAPHPVEEADGIRLTPDATRLAAAARGDPGREAGRRPGGLAQRPTAVTRALVQEFGRGGAPVALLPRRRCRAVPSAERASGTRRPCRRTAHAVPPDGMAVPVADGGVAERRRTLVARVAVPGGASSSSTSTRTTSSSGTSPPRPRPRTWRPRSRWSWAPWSWGW